MWGPLGGVGDCYGALHECGGHYGVLVIATEYYMGVEGTRGSW